MTAPTMNHQEQQRGATERRGRTLRGVVFVIALLAFGALHISAAEPARAFLEEHCFDCHDAETKKGGLDLTTLKFDLAEPATFAAWAKVHELIASGEMPPKKKPRPEPAAKEEILASLAASLDGAVDARRKVDGRTVLRRLNRAEYQNTLRNLLGIEVDVKESLPEDSSASGFDNVGAALQLSPVLMERYLEAADTALDAAIVTGPRPETRRKRYPFIDSVPKYYRNAVLFDEEKQAAVWFRSDYSPTILSQFKAPVPGRYRFRISAFGVQTGGQPMTLSVEAGFFGAGLGGGISRIAGFHEVPVDEPQVIEIVERLDARGDTIRLKPVGTTHVGVWADKVKNYKGPGLGVQWVEVEGPLVESWPPEGHRRLLGDVDVSRGTFADAEKILRRFVPLALRRPMDDAGLQPYLALVRAELDQGRPFEQALRAGLKAALCAPQFLYLKESPGRLDDFAVASRLSYFLWSSMPDEELFDLARQGKLRQPAALRAQVERMLKDPRAAAFTENFVGQWLSLRLLTFTSPDMQLYPEFDEFLQWSMLRETHLFFEELLRNDLSALNFVDSDFTMLNGRLAAHYGIDGVQGVEFRKVSLKPEQQRGGVLTHASVLKVTANGTASSPVLRGVWVLDHILGKPANPPPPNVPAVEPDIRGATTIREQLAKHRQVEGCASCHRKIDPPGFALENYDPIGGWRGHYRVLGAKEPLTKVVFGKRVTYGEGPAVDASNTLPDGRAFTTLRDFKQLLLEDEDQLARALARKLVTYATGHGLEYRDRTAVELIVVKCREQQYGLRSLIHAVVQSELFLNK